MSAIQKKSILTSVREFRDNLSDAHRAIQQFHSVCGNFVDQLGMINSEVSDSLGLKLQQIDGKFLTLGNAMGKAKTGFNLAEQTALSAAWGALSSERLENLYWDSNKNKLDEACMMGALLTVENNQLNLVLTQFTWGVNELRGRLTKGERQIGKLLSSCCSMTFVDKYRVRNYLEQNWGQLCEYDPRPGDVLNGHLSDINNMLQRTCAKVSSKNGKTLMTTE